MCLMEMVAKLRWLKVQSAEVAIFAQRVQQQSICPNRCQVIALQSLGEDVPQISRDVCRQLACKLNNGERLCHHDGIRQSTHLHG